MVNPSTAPLGSSPIPAPVAPAAVAPPAGEGATGRTGGLGSRVAETGRGILHSLGGALGRVRAGASVAAVVAGAALEGAAGLPSGAIHDYFSPPDDDDLPMGDEDDDFGGVGAAPGEDLVTVGPGGVVTRSQTEAEELGRWVGAMAAGTMRRTRDRTLTSLTGATLQAVGDVGLPPSIARATDREADITRTIALLGSTVLSVDPILANIGEGQSAWGWYWEINKYVKYHPVYLVKGTADKIEGFLNWPAELLYAYGIKRRVDRNAYAFLGSVAHNTSSALTCLSDIPALAADRMGRDPLRASPLDYVYDLAEGLGLAGDLLDSCGTQISAMAATNPAKLEALHAFVHSIKGNLFEAGLLHAITDRATAYTLLFPHYSELSSGSEKLTQIAKDVALVAVHDGAAKVFDKVGKPLVIAATPFLTDAAVRIASTVMDVGVSVSDFSASYILSEAAYAEVGEIARLAHLNLSPLMRRGIFGNIVHLTRKAAVWGGEVVCSVVDDIASPLVSIPEGEPGYCRALSNRVHSYYDSSNVRLATDALMILLIVGIAGRALYKTYQHSRPLYELVRVAAPSAVTDPIQAYLARSEATYRAETRPRRAVERAERLASVKARIERFKGAFSGRRPGFRGR